MTEGTQLDALQKDVRDILVAQGAMTERMGGIERSVKETRDDLKAMTSVTIAAMMRDIDTLKSRPVYTPIPTAQQQDLEMWFGRLKTMWTAFGLAQWGVPILLTLVAVAIGIATYIQSH